MLAPAPTPHLSFGPTFAVVPIQTKSILKVQVGHCRAHLLNTSLRRSRFMLRLGSLQLYTETLLLSRMSSDSLNFGEFPVLVAQRAHIPRF